MLFGSIREKLFLRRHMKEQFTSDALRNFYRDQHGLEIGLYSYGCFDPQRIAKGTVIGRYCSFSDTCRILNGNHGIEFISLHPYLYNVALGCVETETIVRSQCVVEDDVWIGHAAIVLPSVTAIGRGAVIGAGAVVTKNVPPYAVVAGNPGRVIRYRFSEKLIAQIEETQWWKLTIDELKQLIVENPQMVFKPQEYFSAHGL
jgi:acetyltransferase-like isoleucine patch superfamily enzyme